MNNIVVFAGSSHLDLVNKICENLGIERSQVKLGKFSNGETSISIEESVREKDVYVIQSGCGHVNDNFMELLILINACKTADASRVTAVMPYFSYSRQPDIPYTAKGAPLISKPKEKYTFESHPGTPIPQSMLTVEKPMSPNSSRLDAASSASSSGPQSLQSPTPLRPVELRPTSSTSSRIPMIPNGKAEHPSEQEQDSNADALFNASNSSYKLWVAQAGTLIANLLTTSGADHVITMDLHDSQFQGFFDIPVDNLYCKPITQAYIQHHIPNYQDCVVVSPDAGGAKRAAKIADVLELSFAMIHKERRSQLLKGPPGATLTSGGGVPVSTKPLIESLDIRTSLSNNGNNKYVNTTMLVGDVRNKECIIVDDLVDTSYTITRAAKLLKDQGATKIYALITHGIFSGDALNRIGQSVIDKIIVTNSIPQDETIKVLGADRVEVLDVSNIFAEAIRRIHNGESISILFEHGW
ncbi:ribose phosphate diphosphokinase subunit PRS5 [Kluyveromyces lactis]|uniref:ribose-phosphate diphosphokinase n=1 Tax=Kluyveromyces lactis (strain ATCC 8585 / CBS 2359 / DSM 70799 / NBRC 1267 / NRRL Y-1140 / WM37) TaxID=284590 RepID=Q6CUL8_KLULA|nr:uncharacterized protein KLLA0_C03916g [Kluyveromyces lactis]CAH01222.1 KLLA0C03916p [Kluyveromyces lactis]|eukprot:XP_452371.1 uncharacterized protein KLLA0_C03916g [Kluyveromyces lactis]